MELIPGEDSEARCLSPATARGSGVSKKPLSPEEIREFDASDAAEWTAIKNAGAARVFSPAEGREVRATCPNRVVSGSMVRRWKPQLGIPRARRPRVGGT